MRSAASPVSQGCSFNGHKRIDGHRFGMLRQRGEGLQQPNTLTAAPQEMDLWNFLTSILCVYKYIYIYVCVSICV